MGAMDRAAELLVMVGVVPLWIAAGVADWACHRRTRIGQTSGLRENAFHWLLLAEGGVALLVTALLEITAGALLLVLASFLLHELTTWAELRYTVPRREVRPIEQMIHSVMEQLPLLLLALLAVTGWGEVEALVGAGTPDFGLRLKAQPWPPAYLAGMAAAVLLLNVLPIAEETVRCLRHK